MAPLSTDPPTDILVNRYQVGLPLARAYFTHAEIDKCTSIFLKTGDPVSLGSFVHVLVSLRVGHLWRDKWTALSGPLSSGPP